MDAMRGLAWYVLVAACLLAGAEARRKLKREDTESLKTIEETDDEVEPCQCAVFMSQQVGLKGGRRGRPRGQPQGEPVVTYDHDEPSLPCGAIGLKHCINKCVDVILKYVPRAGPVICGAVERDVHRERAFLFVRNCERDWTPTNFSAGKEFCCTDGKHHKC
ncbi:follicle cell protein 3C-1 [Pectinophora gossypiella]|uniref:follicle cell protein 3C-1 n=1 Tax=Pectinophora gossypiella TaxID=13191 RepID=UPI00214E9283|nr:follicle cell protein 3C-1 [Pectinophora gossypiella]